MSGSKHLFPPDWPSTIAQRQILATGLSGQTQAGRALAVADFTACGAATPIGLWNFTNNPDDDSGNARHLTNKGSVGYSYGVEGTASTAAQFTGATSKALYLVDSGTTADPFRIRVGSVGCWVKTAKTAVEQYVMSKYRVSSAWRMWSLRISSGDYGKFTISFDGTTPVDAIGTTKIADDRWHFLVGTFDGTSIRIYVDGVLETTTLQVGTIYAGTAATNGPLNIGGYDADSGTNAGSPAYGRVDSAFVSGDVLDTGQIRYLMACKIAHGWPITPTRVTVNTTPQRLGAVFVNGTFPATPTRAYTLNNTLNELNGGSALTDSGSSAVYVAGPDGVAKSGVYLNGSYLRATDTGLPSGTNARSFGCWVKAIPHGSSYQNFLVWGTAGNHSALWIAPGVGNQLGFTSGGDSVTSNAPIGDGIWHSVIAVEDNSAADGVKRKLYLDGKLVAGSTTLNSITLAGSTGFRIGADAGGAQPFYGTVARSWVHAGALTWEQVQAVYMKAAAMMTSPEVRAAGGDSDTEVKVRGLDGTNVLTYMAYLSPATLVNIEATR